MRPGAWRPAIACAACGVAATLIVTIALALGASTAAPMRCTTDPAAPWVRACVEALPSDDTWILQDEHGLARALGTTLRRQRASALTDSGAPSACRHFDTTVAQFGWPLRAMQYEVHRLVPGPAPRPGESKQPRLAHGLALASAPVTAVPAKAIPLRPLWDGLLVDAVTFALVSAAVLLVPASVRRAVRRRRSRCPSCGYRLVHDGPCPECGAQSRRGT